MSRLLLLCIVMVLSACATMPSLLKTGGPYSATTPQQAQSGKHQGERVMWGGRIIRSSPQNEQTCFEIMGMALSKSGEPKGEDHSLGRFIACIKGFYDPAVYAPGRMLTFAGHLNGTEQQKVGDFMYSFPRLSADVLYLWPKRPNVIYVPTYDPFWDPFWPYYYHPYPHRR